MATAETMTEIEQAPNGLHKANGITIVISNDPLSGGGAPAANDSLGAPDYDDSVESDELLLEEKLSAQKARLSIDGYDRLSFARGEDGSGSECSDRLSVSGIKLHDKRKSTSCRTINEPDPEPDGGKKAMKT